MNAIDRHKVEAQELFDTCEKLRMLLDNDAADLVMSRAGRRAFQRKLNDFQKLLDAGFDIEEPK